MAEFWDIYILTWTETFFRKISSRNLALAELRSLTLFNWLKRKAISAEKLFRKMQD